MPRKLPELLTGFAVILIAVLFLVYALGQAGAVSAGGYALHAQFSSIGGLTTGADVKIGGVTIGHVAEEHLDPTTYAAVVTLNIENNVKIPDDSSASVSSEGLLGGDYIAVSPGGSNTMLAPGAAFAVTQSAINIEDLLGKFIFSMGGSGGGKPGASGNSSGASAPSGTSAPGTTGTPSNPMALPTGPQPQK